MDFIVDKFKLLGLNEREIRVFTALGTFGRMNMTKIASRSGLPRTTVDAIVRRLLKQGLISKEKVRGHVEYIMSPDDVADKLDWVEQRLRPKKELEENDVKEGSFDEIFTDEKNVIKTDSFESIGLKMESHSGERVRLMFSHEFGELDERSSRLIKYIELAVQSKLKFEILLSSKMADAIRDREEEVTLPADANLIRLNVVPTSYGTVDTDMIIFRNSILLINPDKFTVEHIKHPTVVETSKHLLGVACETGWSINLTAWLNEN